jgi:outer membrane protein
MTRNNIFSVFILFLLIGYTVQAQTLKAGYIDIQNVFSQLPEAKAAQTSLETYSKQLQKSIDDKKKIFETKLKYYQDESGAGRLTPAMSQALEKELQGLQEQLQIANQDAQQQLQKKNEELMKPIEDKIQNSIKAVATEGGYTMIFGKEMLLYSLPTDDISSQVLKKLGVTPGATTSNQPKTPVKP